MLCSDGLSGLVSPETIGQVMADFKDPGECAEELIRLALLGGGPDNITCVIADIVPAGTFPPAPPQIVGAAAIDRNAKSRGGEGAAARAAALGAKASGHGTDEDDAPIELKPRTSWWTPVFVSLVTVLVVAASWLSWKWTQTQYYAIGQDGYVVIYQGIPQSIGPWRLSHAVEVSDVALVRPVPRGPPAPRHAGAALLARGHRRLHRGPQAIPPSRASSPAPIATPVGPPSPATAQSGAQSGERLLMATVSIAPAKPRRFLELGLMALALAVGISGYVLTSLNFTGDDPREPAHAGRRARRHRHHRRGRRPLPGPLRGPRDPAGRGGPDGPGPGDDLPPRPVVCAAADEAVVGFRQALFVGIAIVIAAIILISLRDHRMLRRYTYTFGALSLFLLLLPMIPGLGQETFGARVWIRLGPISSSPASSSRSRWRSSSPDTW